MTVLDPPRKGHLCVAGPEAGSLDCPEYAGAGGCACPPAHELSRGQYGRIHTITGAAVAALVPARECGEAREAPDTSRHNGRCCKKGGGGAEECIGGRRGPACAFAVVAEHANGRRRAVFRCGWRSS